MAWDLKQMRGMFRGVTGTPDPDQIPDSEVDTLLNNYYVFQMPFELKVQIQNKYLEFLTTPGVDVYAFPGGYFTDSPGAYADGFPLVFYQDPDIFFQDWPQQYAVDNIAVGDGMTSTFTGGLQNPPIIIGSLFFAADDPTGNQQVLTTQDTLPSQTIATGNGGPTYTGTLTVIPVNPGTLTITDGVETFSDSGSGSLTGDMGGVGTIAYATGVWSITFAANVATGISIVANYETSENIGVLTGNGIGTINYLTGAYNITFTNAPASTAVIYAKYQGYAANRPQGVLFFNNEFTFRPVPPQAYQILMQGFVQPTVLVNDGDMPTQPEWGPLIVYGAALERFSYIGDIENYERYYPIFKKFENVALGRTIQQYTAEQSVPRF
jgi:hypothetical protein